MTHTITQTSSSSTTAIAHALGAATDYGRSHGITVIDGGCPCTFEPTADLGHRVMRIV